MTLHPPFFISSALAPALKIGTETLSLLSVDLDGDRDRATFEIRGESLNYTNNELKSGCQGFGSTVEIFCTFLGFLSACGEAVAYKTRTGTSPENATLFPPHIAQWCYENLDEITLALCDLSDEGGEPNYSLIEED